MSATYMPDEDFQQCLYTPHGSFTTQAKCDDCLSRHSRCMSSAYPDGCHTCGTYCKKLCNPQPLLDQDYCGSVCKNNDQCIDQCRSDLVYFQKPCESACMVQCNSDCYNFWDMQCRCGECSKVPICRKHCITQDEINLYVPASTELLLLPQKPNAVCKDNNTDCFEFDHDIMRWRYTALDPQGAWPISRQSSKF